MRDVWVVSTFWSLGVRLPCIWVFLTLQQWAQTWPIPAASLIAALLPAQDQPEKARCAPGPTGRLQHPQRPPQLPQLIAPLRARGALSLGSCPLARLPLSLCHRDGAASQLEQRPSPCPLSLGGPSIIATAYALKIHAQRHPRSSWFHVRMFTKGTCSRKLPVLSIPQKASMISTPR